MHHLHFHVLPRNPGGNDERLRSGVVDNRVRLAGRLAVLASCGRNGDTGQDAGKGQYRQEGIEQSMHRYALPIFLKWSPGDGRFMPGIFT